MNDTSGVRRDARDTEFAESTILTSRLGSLFPRASVSQVFKETTVRSRAKISVARATLAVAAVTDSAPGVSASATAATTESFARKRPSRVMHVRRTATAKETAYLASAWHAVDHGFRNYLNFRPQINSVHNNFRLITQ